MRWKNHEKSETEEWGGWGLQQWWGMQLEGQQSKYDPIFSHSFFFLFLFIFGVGENIGVTRNTKRVKLRNEGGEGGCSDQLRPKKSPSSQPPEQSTYSRCEQVVSNPLTHSRTRFIMKRIHPGDELVKMGPEETLVFHWGQECGSAESIFANTYPHAIIRIPAWMPTSSYEVIKVPASGRWIWWRTTPNRPEKWPILASAKATSRPRCLSDGNLVSKASLWPGEWKYMLKSGLW